MDAHFRKTVWNWDPRWIRVEAFDDRGQPLGIVRFEPNAHYDAMTPAPATARPGAASAGVANCNAA